MYKGTMKKEPHMLVRERRKALDLSQQELADAIDVSQSLISAWEGGRKTIPDDRFVALAEALDTSVSDLRGSSTYVGNDEKELLAWSNQVLDDRGLHAFTQLILLHLGRLSEPALTKDGRPVMTYMGSVEKVARCVESLDFSVVLNAWDDVLSSGYVERYTDAEWNLRLVSPLA